IETAAPISIESLKSQISWSLTIFRYNVSESNGGSAMSVTEKKIGNGRAVSVLNLAKLQFEAALPLSRRARSPAVGRHRYRLCAAPTSNPPNKFGRCRAAMDRKCT